MLDSLRRRLMLSHALPMLVILPILGFTLVYTLETRLLLPDMARELTGDAELLAEVIQAQPEIIATPSLAGQIFERASPRLTKRIMLIDPDGRLLASSDAADQSRIDQILQLDSLEKTKSGQTVALTDYNQRLQGEVIDVFVPILAQDGRFLGTVRVTSRFATVVDELLRLRMWIAATLFIGILFGIILGAVLAVTIAQPVQQVTQAIVDLADGNFGGSISASGPKETRILVGAINSLVARLQNLQSARRQLLANLVHELGRPLGAVRMAVQVILQGSKDDPAQLSELVLGIDQELGGLQRLLEDLTHLYDLDSGAFELERQSIEPGEWLAITLRPWQEVARSKQLHWELAMTPDLPTLVGDPVRLAQVIGNLVSNAIKMTPAGGAIKISAGSQGGKSWIRVADNGPGIQPDELPMIFEPFYRGQTGRRLDSGMGLGLSIAKTLVEAHGGSIQVTSQPGAGSAFTVWLPVELL